MSMSMNINKLKAQSRALKVAEERGAQFVTHGHGFVAFGTTREESAFVHAQIMKRKGLVSP